MSALLFGSLSTLADTSELQRDAFNQAFHEHNLDWHWGPEQYRSLLETSGGELRVADYASALGQPVDARAVHQSKSRIFQASLGSAQVQPRDGVVDTIEAAKTAGIKVAFVTTTSPDNVAALLAALSPHLSAVDFDLVVDASDVQDAKPDKAAYRYAMDVLREQPNDCVAIEDNAGGVQSAVAAGLRCVAFPNTNTANHHFPAAERQVDRLDFDGLRDLLAR